MDKKRFDAEPGPRSIRHNAMLASGGMLACVAALVAITVWSHGQSTHRAVTSVQEINRETVPLLTVSDGLAEVAWAAGAQMFDPTPDAERLERAAADLNAQIATMAGDQTPAEELATRNGITAWRSAERIAAARHHAIEPSDPAAITFFEQLSRSQQSFAEARGISLRDKTDAVVQAEDVAQRSVGAVLVVAFLAAVASLLTASRMLRSITRPLAGLQTAATRLARGDLEHRVPVDGPQEVSVLAAAFNTMAGDLHDRENQLVFRALHDPLTGCGNRALLHDRLQHGLARLERHPHDHLAVFLLDLDGFKKVNDTLGHGTGDAALRIVVERLTPCLRKGDTLTRLGGDEFALAIDATGGGEDDDDRLEREMLTLAHRVCETLRAPIVIDDRRLTLTASLGVATTRDGTPTVDDLIRHADLAMYEAKRQGGDRVERFVPLMDTEASARVGLEEQLRRAVELDQIEVHYQPTVTLASGAVLGVEALVRWRHPTLGLLLPAQFMEIAEDTGLIVEIGTLVLRRATVDATAWVCESPDFVLSVNISARQLQNGRLTQEVTEALAAADFPADRLMLEVTETAMLANLDDAGEQLRPLHGMGVRIALDDFGTGYTSLQYLQRLPVDTLKIDRSFVDGLSMRADQRHLVATILELAHGMDCEVIAEGIEHRPDADALEDLGCIVGQGFHFSRPVPATEIGPILRAQHEPLALSASS